MAPQLPSLPDAPPTFGQPVPVPDPAKGADARLFAAKTRSALISANQRLTDDGAFYGDVQRNFSRP